MLSKNIQNTTGYSTPYTLDGSVLIVNPDLTKGMNIEGYNDLFKPELKGKSQLLTQQTLLAPLLN